MTFLNHLFMTFVDAYFSDILYTAYFSDFL